MPEVHPHTSFVGCWSSDEKALIRQATRTVDDLLALQPVPEALGPAWICHHASDTPSLYVASRAYLEHVIIAESCEELRLRLLQSAGAVTSFEGAASDGREETAGAADSLNSESPSD